MVEPIRLSVRGPSDVEQARRAARGFALTLGFSGDDVEVIVLTVSELATNLVCYARAGTLEFSHLSGTPGRGIQLESRDRGPGIVDIEQAMRDGFSAGGGLGSGLPAINRLMDEFRITSGPWGTIVRARKWLPS